MKPDVSQSFHHRSASPTWSDPNYHHLSHDNNRHTNHSPLVYLTYRDLTRHPYYDYYGRLPLTLSAYRALEDLTQTTEFRRWVTFDSPDRQETTSSVAPTTGAAPPRASRHYVHGPCAALRSCLCQPLKGGERATGAEEKQPIISVTPPPPPTPSTHDVPATRSATDKLTPSEPHDRQPRR